MSLKYWYIDDSPQRTGIAKGLISKGKLDVESRKPDTWKEIIPETGKGNIDGLLLDWQLQQEAEGGDYSSAALAQELRVLATQGILKGLPIILCSAQDSFEEKYRQDMTTHDLFDMVYSKTALKEDKTQHEFITLAEGYKSLNNTNKMHFGVLGISLEDYERLDVRFQAEFKRFFDLGSPAHQIAQFLLREVLEHQGILIDEYVLAARLGVDKSSTDWEALKGKLETARYKGVFSEAWMRWWWFEVERWWGENFAGVALRSSLASVRVEHIKIKMNLPALTACAKTPKSRSETFWTACHFSKMPLDTVEGFTLLEDENLKVWQEKRYVSLDYALEHQGKIEIATIEVPRFKKLKEAYGNR